MRGAIEALLPRSIVARTTFSIIVLAILLGLVFAGLAAWMLQQNEKSRLETRLGELLSTVEQTVRVACFVKDDALAREIVEGLMSNEFVAGVRIVADGRTLHEQARAESPATDEGRTLSISRPIQSPFDDSEQVGEIVLYASEATLHKLAWSYVRYVLLVLAFEVALIAVAVARVVFNLITRPIKNISDELHRMELRTGMRLRVPARNEKDELGRLVSDVNALIARLTALIDTERKLRLEREASERRLALIFEKVDAGIFEVERNGLLHTWNPAFVRTLGQPPEPPELQAMIPGHELLLQKLINESLSTGKPREADLELHTREGHTQWAEISLTPVGSALLQGVINDITERKRSEFAAQQLASRDGLTGLLNRRGIDAGLAAAFERRRHEPSLAIALMLIDLDHFKQVNDTHGHAAGDVVLKRVAEILERAVRKTDLVGRPGGDEFTVALIGVDSPDKARQIAQTIIDEVSMPIEIDRGTKVRIGASIGIAMAATGEESAGPALHRADEAMYAAKQAGRCRAHFAATPQPREKQGETEMGRG